MLASPNSDAESSALGDADAASMTAETEDAVPSSGLTTSIVVGGRDEAGDDTIGACFELAETPHLGTNSVCKATVCQSKTCACDCSPSTQTFGSSDHKPDVPGQRPPFQTHSGPRWWGGGEVRQN